jgi:glycosyltransferase involved in cell wall biosynthesis
MKKKILLVGPISNVGGREIETQLIHQALCTHYDVEILSTHDMTDKSMAIKDFSVNWTTLKKELTKDLPLFIFSKILSFITKKSLSEILSNKYVKKIFKVEFKYFEILKKQIISTDIVFFIGQPQSIYLNDTIKITKQFQKKCFLRITGTINEVSEDFVNQSSSIDTILLHSYNNCKVLLENKINNFKVIDQAILFEDRLINLPYSKGKIDHSIKYGFLGRLSKEKGLVELIQNFKSLNFDSQLYIAGEGPLLDFVLNSEINYLGSFENEHLLTFFNQIDVLIISSYQESGPLVAIEAAAAGKIILSTDVGAMKERFKDCPSVYWYDLFDINSLKVQLENINALSHDEINFFQRQIRQLFYDKFRFEKLSKQYITILN